MVQDTWGFYLGSRQAHCSPALAKMFWPGQSATPLSDDPGSRRPNPGNHRSAYQPAQETRKGFKPPQLLNHQNRPEDVGVLFRRPA